MNAPSSVPPPIAAHRPPVAAKQNGNGVLPWFIAFMALSTIAWIYQQLDFAGSAEIGIPIPDVVNMTRGIDNFLAAGGIAQDGDQFVGVSILFGWTWLLHPGLSFVVNAVMMAWATRIYSNLFIKKLQIPSWSVVSLLGNPYLMLAMAGPNKEIPLTLLTLVYASLIVRKPQIWPLWAIIVSVATYLFRDGYGAFLLATTGLTFFFRSRAKPYTILMCTGSVAAATLFGLLSNIIPLLSRNIQSFEVANADNLAVGAVASLLSLDPFSPLGGFLAFGLRLIYNLFSGAFFPVLTTTGGIYWIGIAYWVNGLATLILLPACLVAVVQGKVPKTLIQLGAIPFATWFMISVSLFVQPRYLLPVLPLAGAVFAGSPRNTRIRCLQFGIGLTAAILVIYRVLDHVPPIGDPDEFDPPPYILNQ